MNKHFAKLAGVVSVAACVGAQAQEAQSLQEALTDGDAQVSLRLRYETVEWEGLEDSDALTLKTRLSYTTADFNGLGVTLEMDDVQSVTDVDYRTAPNDPNNPGTAVIADPEGTEVNQAFVSYKGLGASEFRYGRQRITLDNQRFIGAVGWRQNDQTFDSFSFSNTALEGAKFFYAYVYNANRIFGDDNPQGNHKHESHLLNFNYAFGDAGKLSAYAYLLDNKSAAALSSDSYGLRWAGKVGEAFSYNLEYANQQDAGDNPVSYQADYILADAGYKLGGVTLGGGYELLGSDEGKAGFTTSLATLHKFQGWTDRFLSTPADGIEDFYISASGSVAGIKLMAVYHDLASDYQSTDYGQEIDISAATSFGPVGVLLKYADYQADDFGSDTQKIWLQLSSTF
ncbi:alginate export family protein [Gilvimarinus sp. DA14]|uniref:alginate export family protein n=1 Tax=Gilvimarinus sp. DA14 TaxID=2956798 RepID=UPI0020B876A6|nr:alginate export family protein [Gilvimarinus sp. DA14]UTF60333.1 alginate export family protein [Gilvimarinus sp. DA14]